jgi:DNA polymerase-3 subunit beta
MEIALTGASGAAVERAGAITLPAMKLAEIVRALPNTEIRMTFDNGVTRIAGGKYASRLQTLVPEDFPALQAMNGETPRVLPRNPLRRLVAQTRYAIAAGGDQRFWLNGALLKWDGDKIQMIATDSHRLAVAVEPYAAPESGHCLIPAKALAELDALLAEDVAEGAPGDVTFAVGERHLFFALDGRLLSSVQVEGNFPAWERSIPKGNDKKAVVDRGALLAAIRRVQLVSSGDARSISFTLAPNEIRLAANSAELGDADEAVGAQYAGEIVEVRIQGQFVVDFLEAARNETVTMAVKDSVSQVLFSDGEQAIGVMMPIRL